MKLLNTLFAVTATIQYVGAVAVPTTDDVTIYSRSQQQNSGRSTFDSFTELWKRKGGGGSSSGGGKGGSSGGSSSSSGGRSGSSSSGSSSSGSSSSGSSSGSSGSRGSSGSSSSSGSSGSSSGSSGSSSSAGKGGSSSSSSSGSTSGRGSSTSNTGGSTKTGSGPSPAYGAGGAFYGGGAKTPYSAGRSSPSGIVPGLLIGSSLGFLGAYWLLGAYHYPYAHPYTFHNVSSNQNETKPVECLCAVDQECGCDDNSADTAYMNSIIGNGSYDGLNKTLVTVANANGTDTIFINGTLPNGTTASGGTDDAFSAAEGARGLLRAMGWFPIATTVLALAFVA